MRPALQPFRPPAACFARESGCSFILHMHFPRLCPTFMAAASAITPLPSIAGPSARLPLPESVSCIAVVAACPSSLLAPPASLSGSHDTAQSGNTPSTTPGGPPARRLTLPGPTSAASVLRRSVELLNSISQ